jgi:hypothetical protein
MSPKSEAAGLLPEPAAETNHCEADGRDEPTTDATTDLPEIELPDAKPDTVQDEQPRRRDSQATRLVALAREQTDLWHAAGEAYATVMFDDRREHHRLTSKDFRSWLARLAHESEERAPNGAALSDTLTVLHGYALETEHPVFIRVTGDAQQVLLDLGDALWRVVEISAAGWRVRSDSPARFDRRRAMRPLAEPVAGGRLEELREHVRVTDSAWPLFVGWLVGALAPRGPYPVLVLRGSQGTGKSHVARIARDLLDPSIAPLRTEPREGRDLVVAARGSWVVAFDNVSHLPPWLSDGLCRLATGGGYVARQLFTDGEEFVLDAQRPVILTGITDVATAPDLLDRSLLVELEPIPDAERRTERELLEAWSIARPRIQGALLDAVACAIRRYADVRLPALPRMADWAKWATAAEPALGLDEGAIVRAHTGTRRDAVDVALDASPISEPLRSLAGETLLSGTWTGSATDLREALSERVDLSVTRRNTWPQTPEKLVADLQRLAPVLLEVGVVVERDPRRQGHRAKRLWRVRLVEPAAPAAPAAPPEVNAAGAASAGGLSGFLCDDCMAVGGEECVCVRAEESP